MNRPDRNKVCFDILGIPAIVRALGAYESAGIDRHILVVGNLREEVENCLAETPFQVLYALQREPLGTGHAARCGADVMRMFDYNGLVLVAAGDKFVEPEAVRRLIARQAETDADLVFLVTPATHNPDGGRVISHADGTLAAIVEARDIRATALVEALVAELRGRLSTGSEEGALGGDIATSPLRGFVESRMKADKIAAALGPAYPLLYDQETVNGAELLSCSEAILEHRSLILRTEDGPERVSFSAAETLSGLCNASIYLFKAPALYYGLDRITRGNVQGEEYITDVVKILCSSTVESLRDSTVESLRDSNCESPRGSTVESLRDSNCESPRGSTAESARDSNCESVRDSTVDSKSGSDAAPPAFSAIAVAALSPTDVQGFNTLEELWGIEQSLREREAKPPIDPAYCRPVRTWLNWCGSEQAIATLATYYGPEIAPLQRKCDQIRQALQLYADRFSPDDSVIIARSPGRFNLMGRHIDHRGGCTNVIAISDEIIIIASPREDDRIELVNAHPQFEPASFSIGEEMSELNWSDWLVCVNDPKTLRMLQGSEGDWAHYARAAIFRLQAQFGDIKLRGMNVAVHGSIPVGSGLSSSSAVVVGVSEAAIKLNSLPVAPAQLVDLCGEGEWFVGTRGGKGDHAAIKLGRRNYVAHVSFMPFEPRAFVPFFDGYSLVVVNSGQQARKSAGAKAIFNERILGYTAGEILLCKLFPQYAPRIDHLRDVNCENLGIELHELYWMLLQLPQEMTREELLAQGPFSREHSLRLGGLIAPAAGASAAAASGSSAATAGGSSAATAGVASAATAGVASAATAGGSSAATAGGSSAAAEAPFPVRGVVLFGLAECERSRLSLQYLQSGDIARFGELWYLSHDGDRVVAHDSAMNAIPWEYSVTDEYLQALIRDAQSSDPQRNASAALHRQPGKYDCSTAAIDRLVDTARRFPGVEGAQLAGAGLGGCIIVLVADQHAEALIAMYEAAGFKAARYTPVEGAGVVGGEAGE